MTKCVRSAAQPSKMRCHPGKCKLRYLCERDGPLVPLADLAQSEGDAILPTNMASKGELLERTYGPRTRKFGPKDTIIVSLDTMIFSDVPCSVCDDLIPYDRAHTAKTLNPEGKPEYCSDRCMKTSNMRVFRANVSKRKTVKRRATSKKAAA